MNSPPLIGREQEKRLLLELLEQIQTRGAALVLRGEAGIGKSRLLELAKEQAQERGVRVLRTAGTESESYLPSPACTGSFVQFWKVSASYRRPTHGVADRIRHH